MDVVLGEYFHGVRVHHIITMYASNILQFYPLHLNKAEKLANGSNMKK